MAKRCEGDRGTVAVQWALFGFVLLLMSAVLFEGGQALAARRSANNLALQAARAGAQEIDEDAVRGGPAGLNVMAAEATARSFVAGQVESASVRVTGDQVTVTVVINHPTPALGVIGMRSRTVTATESARAIRGGL